MSTETEPETYSCFTCGFTWIRGKSGDHSCTATLAKTVAKCGEAINHHIGIESTLRKECDLLQQRIAAMETAFGIERAGWIETINDIQSKLAAVEAERDEVRKIWEFSAFCKAAQKEAQTENHEAGKFASWFQEANEQLLASQSREAALRKALEAVEAYNESDIDPEERLPFELIQKVQEALAEPQ